MVLSAIAFICSPLLSTVMNYQDPLMLQDVRYYKVAGLGVVLSIYNATQAISMP